MRVQGVKVLDFTEWSATGNGDCRTPCLNNCSSIAYAYDPGIGCMFWSRELIDIQSFSDGGIDLFIRLPYSKIGKFYGCFQFLLNI